MKKVPLSSRGVLGAAAVLIVILFVVSCKKNNPTDPGGAAQGSLWGADGSCLPSLVVGGPFYKDREIGDSTYVAYGINVTKTGSYKIQSELRNGVQFSDSGSFTATGFQTIHLRGKGTFADTGNVDYNISFGNSICTFTLHVGRVPVPNQVWQFISNGRLYKGSAGVLIYSENTSTFDLEGYADGSHDTTITMKIKMPFNNGGATYGKYLINTQKNQFILAVKGVPIMQGGTGLGGEILWELTGSERVNTYGIQYIGNFSGTCVDGSGNPVTITLGTFRAGSE